MALIGKVSSSATETGSFGYLQLLGNISSSAFDATASFTQTAKVSANTVKILNATFVAKTSGDTGAQGAQGAAPGGATGHAGATGAQGSQGGQGGAGPSGHPGAQGGQGSSPGGPTGPTGATGAQGGQGGSPGGGGGATGATGAQGSQGGGGPTGHQGATGAQGGQGGSPGGPTGPGGPGGATGAQGGAGTSSEVYINKLIVGPGPHTVYANRLVVSKGDTSPYFSSIWGGPSNPIVNETGGAHGGYTCVALNNYYGGHIFSFYSNRSTYPSGMSSDTKSKTDISVWSSSEPASNTVVSMSQYLKRFQFSTPSYNHNIHRGFVAQDIEESGSTEMKKFVYSTVPKNKMDYGDIYFLDYFGLGAVTTKAVSELNTYVENLESRVAVLKG
jgi:hypothetical protein